MRGMPSAHAGSYKHEKQGIFHIIPALFSTQLFEILFLRNRYLFLYSRRRPTQLGSNTT
jgi:hypothetical protein